MEYNVETLIAELRKLDKLEFVPEKVQTQLEVALVSVRARTLQLIARKCVAAFKIQEELAKKVVPPKKKRHKYRDRASGNLNIKPVVNSPTYKPGAFGYKSGAHTPKTPGIISPTGKPYAVVPCKYYLTPGGCSKGRNCPFSHNEDERAIMKKIVYGGADPSTVYKLSQSS